MKKLKMVIDIILGRFTLIHLSDGDTKELVVYPSKFTKKDLEKVATMFFREVYNLH